MKYTFAFIMVLMWMMGIVLAKGFWSTFTAIFFVPYSFYLTVEHFMILAKII